MQRKHGPVYRTLDALGAFAAWETDDTHWILTDETAYLVGYAPAIFGMGPMAQGWRITCPEELLQRAHAEAQTTQRYAHLVGNPVQAAAEQVGEAISVALGG